MHMAEFDEYAVQQKDASDATGGSVLGPAPSPCHDPLAGDSGDGDCGAFLPLATARPPGDVLAAGKADAEAGADECTSCGVAEARVARVAGGAAAGASLASPHASDAVGSSPGGASIAGENNSHAELVTLTGGCLDSAQVAVVGESAAEPLSDGDALLAKVRAEAVLAAAGGDLGYEQQLRHLARELEDGLRSFRRGF